MQKNEDLESCYWSESEQDCEIDLLSCKWSGSDASCDPVDVTMCVLTKCNGNMPKRLCIAEQSNRESSDGYRIANDHKSTAQSLCSSASHLLQKGVTDSSPVLSVKRQLWSVESACSESPATTLLLTPTSRRHSDLSSSSRNARVTTWLRETNPEPSEPARKPKRSFICDTFYSQHRQSPSSALGRHRQPTNRTAVTPASRKQLFLESARNKSSTELTPTSPSLSGINSKPRRSPRIPKPRRSLTSDVFYSQCRDSPSCDPEEKSWQLSAVMVLNGCGVRCATTIHSLTEYDILLEHSGFWSKSYSSQRQWLLDYFRNHCPNSKQGDRDLKSMQYILSGRSVCQSLWLAALSISSSRFYSVRSDFLEGIASVSLEKRSRVLAPKSLAAIAWMKNYFDRVGDKRPDKEGIYLPTCLTEFTIYNVMLDELRLEHGSKPICFSQFNKLFHGHFPNVTIPKQCRFTKCTFCTLVKNELMKVSTTKQEKEKLRELLQDHLKLQEQERQRYYSNRQLAIESSDEYLSIILDGMDQNKTNVPHLVRVPKSCQNLWCLRTHLTGCLVHGVGNFGYFDFIQWPHDCNLTITTLLFTLANIAHNGYLPRRLLLQMDNCVRENKNKYVFGFLALLVEKKIFNEIEVGFLMVGHTHEDIDQSFSCLSRHLNKHDAMTNRDMEKRFQESNRTTVAVTSLQYVYDVRAWISPHLEEITKHTAPHIFRFHRSSEGRAVMHYKHWSHESWEPPQKGLLLLKRLPDDSPSLVEPSLAKIDLKRLKTDMNKYNSAGIFSEDSVIYWRNFLDGFESTYGQIPNDPVPWILNDLPTVAPAQAEQVNIPEKISKIHQFQTQPQQSKIQLGKTSKKKAPAKTVTASELGNPVLQPSTPQESAAAPELPNSILQLSHKTLGITTETPTPTLEVGKAEVGQFVALRLVKYDDEVPQIAKVVGLDDMDVTVQWWLGRYHENWREWKKKDRVVEEKLPRNAIIKSGITLTRAKRLTKAAVNELKLLYDLVEFI